ncbi:uncharacterized protein LOC133197236 isoform X2 [Saccostrea echinata]|uniref:uncharacterized protein LOC133197236 isoform X2 n=1 Tax=Saccostrea echinata TaxID=191078 RepID=UPI002A820531|nr:uncharacterized protein LOC133197236 isoform X2 [Saccostrea echinata]
MKLIYLCVICLNFPSFGSTQNVRIQVQPLSVNLRQDDLVVTCSTVNPSQLDTVYTIQLQKNNTNTYSMKDVVSVRSSGGQNTTTWQDTELRNRASVTGTVSTPATAQLKLTIPKDQVLCPQDFTGYMCIMSGFTTALVTQVTSQEYVTYIVHPTTIEMPTVRILGEFSNTPSRQFPVGTAIQLTCTGQIGSDASATIRWCAKKSQDFTFTGLPQTPVHSEASPSSGCQYTRSSTITYNLTSDDTYTQFLCESGYSGLCETGTAKQYLNITLEGNAGTPITRTSEETSDAGIIAGGVIGGLAFLILVILLVYFLVLRRKTDGETLSSPTDRTKEDVPGYNGPANPEGPVYSVPVKDHPPERQPRKKHPRDHEDDGRRRYRRGHENEGLDDEHTEKREMDDDNKYENHGYTNRVMNEYNDGDVMPRGGQGIGSAV